MSRRSKFLKRKRREEKRLAARAARIEQEPPDRLVCSFCQQRPPKFLVLVNPKVQSCTYVVWGEDLQKDENWQRMGRLMCNERHCFFQCFDAWREFQEEWIAETQAQGVMQKIQALIQKAKGPEPLEEETVATE